MRKYRKKPVVIEAALLTNAAFDGEHPRSDHIVGVTYDPVGRCAYIDTPEGRMTAYIGDYIIRGVKGELYPCKADIFAMTYEPVLE